VFNVIEDEEVYTFGEFEAPMLPALVKVIDGLLKVKLPEVMFPLPLNACKDVVAETLPPNVIPVLVMNLAFAPELTESTFACPE
jgi:hypothetical protein